MKKYCMLILFILSPLVFAQNTTPKFTDYQVSGVYQGNNHKLVLDDFGKNYKTRLQSAIERDKPSFAGHYIVTGWGCGSGGCNTGAVIDAITGQAYPLPVALSAVYPLKPEFANEVGEEHIYKLNSRLMIFAGNIDGVGEDVIQFYEFKNDKFILLKSEPYNKAQVKVQVDDQIDDQADSQVDDQVKAQVDDVVALQVLTADDRVEIIRKVYADKSARHVKTEAFPLVNCENMAKYFEYVAGAMVRIATTYPDLGDRFANNVIVDAGLEYLENYRPPNGIDGLGSTTDAVSGLINVYRKGEMNALTADYAKSECEKQNLYVTK